MNDHYESRRGYWIEELEIGMQATVSKAFSEDDIAWYARLSMDTNPLHLDEAFAVHARTGGRVLHGMITASLISSLIGTRLPGPGCLWMAQDMRFLAPVRIGETVRALGEILEVDRDRQQVVMATTCRVAETMVLDGRARIWVPSRDGEQQGR